MLFLFFTLFCTIIFSASSYGVLAPMRLPAAEGAAKVCTAGIPRMGEKYYPAMPAPRKTFFQVGLFLENGSNNPIILRNNTANLFFAVPVTIELKIGLYLYYKKAKCSLMSLMYLGIPSLSLFSLAINKVQ